MASVLNFFYKKKKASYKSLTVTVYFITSNDARRSEKSEETKPEETIKLV